MGVGDFETWRPKECQGAARRAALFYKTYAISWARSARRYSKVLTWKQQASPEGEEGLA
ncbi:MAG: hypothetical protein QOC71_1709 [Thermoplasmata archaeon]|nr:hypothetical protein [Thermoplasmata archaeon]